MMSRLACWIADRLGSSSPVRSAGQVLGHPLGRGDQEVAAAAGRVADLQVEQGLLGIGLVQGFLDDRIEGRVEQAVDQRGGRVVAAGRLPLVPRGYGQDERPCVCVDAGVQLEERLVDRAQLLGAEVAEVHRPQHGATASRDVLGVAEVADRFEQVLVGQRCGIEVRGRLGREQERAEAGDGQRGIPAPQLLEEDLERLVKVGVGRPTSLRRQLPESSE